MLRHDKGFIFTAAGHAQQARLKNPPVPMAELLELFERLGLIETVAEFRRLMPG